MPNSFQDIEKEFASLRRSYFQGRVSEQEFKDRLKQLRFKDRRGRCWTIGARTGKWYYYNGSSWVESRPPSLQSGRAICIYCGYENDLEDEACGYCGGNLEGGRYSCPKCGTRLKSPTQACPRCESGDHTTGSLQDSEPPTATPVQPIEAPSEDSDEPDPLDETDKAWQQFERLDSDMRSEEQAMTDDGGPNYVVRAFNPVSFALFWGLCGLGAGLLFGVFAGTSDFFLPTAAHLPLFLQALHGKLIGGLVFGILGGVSGFGALAALGLLLSVPFNLVLSLMGGLKFRLEKL